MYQDHDRCTHPLDFVEFLIAFSRPFEVNVLLYKSIERFCDMGNVLKQFVVLDFMYVGIVSSLTLTCLFMFLIIPIPIPTPDLRF